VVRDRSEYSVGTSTLPRRSSESRPPSSPREFRLTTAAALGGAAAAGPPGDLDAFRPGVAVLHPQYGLGRIVAVDGAGPNRKGRVAFTVGGERTFVLARSPLKPL